MDNEDITYICPNCKLTVLVLDLESSTCICDICGYEYGYKEIRDDTKEIRNGQ